MITVRPGETEEQYVVRASEALMEKGLPQEVAMAKSYGVFKGHQARVDAGLLADQVYVQAIRNGQPRDVAKAEADQARRVFLSRRANEVRKSLANYASHLGRVEKAAAPDGTVHHRTDGDYVKTGGQWVKRRTTAPGAHTRAATAAADRASAKPTPASDRARSGNMERTPPGLKYTTPEHDALRKKHAQNMKELRLAGSKPEELDRARKLHLQKLSGLGAHGLTAEEHDEMHRKGMDPNWKKKAESGEGR